MKRLIASLAVSLGLVLANVGSVLAADFWELQMFDPATTTARKINIEYKVFSTNSEDDFAVNLSQNGTVIANQTIETPHGDSSVFTVDIPASGTYTYEIEAVNSRAGATPQDDTESRTVQVVDGPAPIVTTVFVNNGAGGGQGAGGTGAGGANAADGGQGAGEVAGDVADEGTVGAEAATDENQGDVLGAENDEAAQARSRNTAIAIVLAVAAIGVAYYWFIMRPKVD
jgi:hypothetical protein